MFTLGLLKKQKIFLFVFFVCIAIIGATTCLSYGVEQSNEPMDEEDNIEVPKIPKFVERGNRGMSSDNIVYLCLHEVGFNGDALSVQPEQLRRLIREFVSQGYTFIDLNDLRAYMDGEKELPKKGVFLGFDDGYLDNYTYAYPILREEGAKATFFIVSGSIGKENRMTQDQIKELISKGFSIGSHTVSHDDLSKMSDEEIEHQLRDSQKELEDMFDVPIDAIAYPCGYENPSVVEIAKKYYKIGFLASMEKDETVMTINRHGVFRWTNHINSLTNNGAAQAHG